MKVMIRNETEHLSAILGAAVQLIIEVGVLGIVFWDTEQVQITFTSGKEHETGVETMPAKVFLGWFMKPLGT